jgi:hypothetical protein
VKEVRQFRAGKQGLNSAVAAGFYIEDANQNKLLRESFQLHKYGPPEAQKYLDGAKNNWSSAQDHIDEEPPF